MKKYLNDIWQDKIFLGIMYILLVAIGLIYIIPLLYVVSVSLTPYSDVLERGGFIFWPSNITFEYFEYLLNGSSPVLKAFANSCIVTVGGTAISLFVTILTAYPLSKPHLVGRKFFTMLFVVTMIFNGGMIPTYLAVRSYGLLDSFLSLMLPSMIGIQNLIVMRTFFAGSPVSLEESAKLDGCGDWGVLFRIVLPTSKPVLYTIGLFYAVSRRNSFYDALIYIGDKTKYTLPIILRQIMVLSEANDLNEAVIASEVPPIFSLQMACAVIVLVPMMIVYPFIQKHFAKGMMIGSVKG